MLNQTQIDRMLGKLKRFETTLEPLIFTKTGEIDFSAYVADKQYHQIPDSSLFTPVEKGWHWDGEGKYCWYKGKFVVPSELSGKPLYIRPHMEGYEAMLWVDGKVFGTFATKIVYTGHGNHYCDMLVSNPKAGQVIDIAIEYYGGHHCIGLMPFEVNPIKSYNFAYDGADICVKNYEIQEFYFDLMTLNQMAEHLPENSFRRADVINCLYAIHKGVYYSIDDIEFETFMEALREVKPLMKKVLSVKNSASAPFAGIVGHSHMDTAWLWHIDETIKKCARTYANQLSLMEQYPEYKFIQSSACHSNMLLRHYPELFERIKDSITKGKYEPNGGVWVECDCNITSGESMVRQFLWGQRFTRKHFNFSSNCFWLPDTFGYSAAIPQIMKSCGVDYFLTTKIGWNDTNRFPYDTFYWQGIDGTKVFSHFNTTHHEPDVKHFIERLDNGLSQKTVTDKRYLAYGYGDGGGGPQFEMIEMARRCEDLDGVAKSKHMLVADFMKELETSVVEPNVYKGELYLELHRGTLTNQHTIKRNNRKAELALRDLEYITVNEAVKNAKPAKDNETQPLYETLLINQFHDILPGTSITRVHEESRDQMSTLINSAKDLVEKKVKGKDKNKITLVNTLSFERNDTVFLNNEEGYVIKGPYPQQAYTDIDGNKKRLLSNISVPAFSSISLSLEQGTVDSKGPFNLEKDVLETPYFIVRFDEKGQIISLYDKKANRELKGEGYPLNTFLLAEDVPTSWDNWDVDADIEVKYKECSSLISREVVSDGAVAFVIRSEYKISSKSTIKQDMIFFASSPEIRFDTAIDWNDDHRFLKAAFDTDIFEDFVRQEIQFGYVKRPTTRNNSLEQAKFETVNHKYTDLSELNYGAALLNDCKYGITVNGGSMHLSLHKGGTRPDEKGDKDGIHRCVYSFLPHNSSFSAKSVIKPSYMLNVPYIEATGDYKALPLIKVLEDNIIVESIKPCEDNQKAFIARLYEAEGNFAHTKIELLEGTKEVSITNMLEEEIERLPLSSDFKLTFRPFEIKTLKISY